MTASAQQHGQGMTVQFCVLGDVEAHVDGRPLALGHARQQCVLVSLLLDANNIVSTDRLIDRVWGERGFEGARGSVYSYLSRLRQILKDAPGISLTRRPGGYVLAADPDAVDLHRFRNLVALARASRDDEHAQCLLEDALQLWRGEPFGVLDTDWLNDQRESLKLEHLAAELDCTDLRLRRGDHGSLVTGLLASSRVHPFDERLSGQLMLAQYRCGRVGDALAHYQHTRRRLVDELGIEPGPALRRLHEQILHADPDLAIPPAQLVAAGKLSPTGAPTLSGSPPGPAPHQLPASPRGLVGRRRELAELTIAKRTGARRGGPTVIVTIVGTGGIGKTWLAAHWAHQVADEFPDGQLHVNLRGFDSGGVAVEPTAAVRGFLQALGTPPDRIPVDLDDQAALYRSLVAGKRVLVVLDNARDADQVRPLLPGSPGCLVVVTSRNQLASLVAVEGAQPVTLDLLAPAEAREMLASRLGAARVAAEPAATEEIIAQCAGLPLALAIVAGRSAIHPTFSLDALARDMRTQADRLDAFDSDDATDLRSVFSWSYRSLSPDAARLFRLLGLHPGPDFTAPAAASLAGQPLPETRRLLAALSGANLINEHQPGRYAFHDLLRTYAAAQVHAHDSNDERTAALRRILEHYLYSAQVAAGVLYGEWNKLALAPACPGVAPEAPNEHQQALDWFAAEHPVVLLAVGLAARSGLETHAWQLAWTLMNALEARGCWRELAAANTVALDAAERADDPIGQAYAHQGLGRMLTWLGRHDDARAHLEHALAAFVTSGDPGAQGSVRLGLGSLSDRIGDDHGALRESQLALCLFRSAARTDGEAIALNNIGWSQARLGNNREAFQHCQQALDLHRKRNDRQGQAAALDSLGYIHHHLGQLQRAIDCYGDALDLYRGLSDRYCEADTLSRIGDSQLSAGNSQAAHHAWTLAENILRELGHPDAGQTRAKLDLLAASEGLNQKPGHTAADGPAEVRGSNGVSGPEVQRVPGSAFETDL
jgi:DNA-binding SARP family transcriptional activator/tetratricopeptide (TPR) repeat protein